MTLADIEKKYTQCVKHADLGAYTQCVYTDVVPHLKKTKMLTKNEIEFYKFTT